MKKGKGKKDISILARFILLMRSAKKRLSELKPAERLKKRQKALASYSEGVCPEETKISYGFGIARVTAVILLVLLLSLSLIFGSGVVSYEKMYYMFKDIAYIKSYGEGVPGELSYSRPVRNQVYADFKNGLLVAGDSELKFFTSTGRVTLNEGSEFTNPHVVCSGSNALIYDQGRRTYSIYNSFVKLYSDKTEYRIAAADMAENGSYVILTKSKLYNSVVKIYDHNYSQIGEYNKNDTVISVSMSDDGRYAAILSLSAHGGVASMTLDVLDCKKNEVSAHKTVEGSIPYMCEFLPDGRIAIFANDKFLLVNKKADTVFEYEYISEVETIDISRDGFAILFSETEVTGDKILEIFDINGKKIFSKNIKENVRDIKLGDKCIYILKNNEVVRINTSLGTESRIASPADNMKIVVFGDGRAAVCSQSAATYILFD